jgi:hypothetical protein
VSDRKAYFFLSSQYIRYDVTDDGIDTGYPRALPGGWGGLTFTKIDAAVNWGNGKIYLFSGTKYARFTPAADVEAGIPMDSGYPLDIVGNWAGLPFSTIDAAINLGNGLAYLFSGDQYVSYDVTDPNASASSSRQIAPDWPGLFPSAIDAAVNWGNGKAYFFSGSKYVRFDIATNRADDGYPLDTAAQWPSPIAGTIDASVERFTAPATPPRCIPVFEPSYWNDGADLVKAANPRSVQKTDNCYNYATDIPNRTFAQPGQASGHPIVSLADCADAIAGATSDGLTASVAGAPCPGCCHQTALVVWPNRDYHWYRLDGSGQWSHKPGRTPATDRDNSGNVITNPETADRGPYTKFCGYFCACSGLHVRGPLTP